MDKYVLHFNEIDKSSLPYVGGKGANLGEMTKANFPVPQGFCVTTLAYKSFIETSTEMDEFFKLLEDVNHNDLEKIKVLGSRVREHIQSMPMPDNIKESILKAFNKNGKEKAYAVRSSATAEDLPTASFAGQQDTYLNICGERQLFKAVQNCWASLFTDRAISYRAKNGFNHRSVYLSVVVQQMVFPEVSGIMFTADPISGQRKTVSIDASFGLGEALVSGLVTADLYQVRFNNIVKKQISKKKIAIYSIPEGGTVTKDVPLEKQQTQALSDDRILELSSLGQKIEAHYGSEQDIEWGFSENKLYILQSRPITSLYPLPQVSDDKLHAFMSFGHLQMMTDSMLPLSISLFKNISNFLDIDFVYEAGGRMFADVTGPLLIKPIRNRFLKVFKGMDELIASALSQVSEREDFLKTPIPRKKVLQIAGRLSTIIIPMFIKVLNNLLIKDPEAARDDASRAIEEIRKNTESYIFSSYEADRIQRIKMSMGSIAPNVVLKIAVYFIAGVLSAGSLEKILKKKFGDTESAYLLSQLGKSLPGNVTTELGLRVGDLADAARKYPEVVEYLNKADNETFFEGLLKVSGGAEFKPEFVNFLKEYGMRCSGEIDITKPRWYEEPMQLVPSILSNISTSQAGEHREKFSQGELEAEQAANNILKHFTKLERKRVSRLIRVYRNLMGMREHHKFAVILILDIYKRALLKEAQSFVKKGILQNEKDIFYLTLDEIIKLYEGSSSQNLNEHIDIIKKKYEQYEKLTPPRVITSEGEIITGRVKNVNAPEGALIGIPVSAGTVEGIARVVTKLEDAKLNPGEILVASYTDPGWTPLFISAIGLITEIGGMMTHGSVIAREYGIPAVVGVDKATELIKDGSYIRINGTEGFVEILKH